MQIQRAFNSHCTVKCSTQLSEGKLTVCQHEPGMYTYRGLAAITIFAICFIYDTYFNEKVQTSFFQQQATKPIQAIAKAMNATQH